MNLVDFLLARITEDEQTARASQFNNGKWTATGDWLNARRHIIDACTDEAVDRVKVRPGVYEYHRTRVVSSDDDTADAVLRFLALPYADHPDYRQEWTP